MGRLNYISHFISQLTAKCDPIFKLLRKHNPGEWDKDCHIAFEKVKDYLSNPPILVPPISEKPLILYLTVHERAMGCVLGQRDESKKKEHAIYYLRKKFIEYKEKYSSLEKICCALAWATQQLRQYMLYHTTWLIAKLDSIKYIFERSTLSGRLARWQVLLLEYDIQYMSRKAIKGSAIAEFLADRVVEEYGPIKFEFPDEDLMAICHIEDEFEQEEPWKLYFDGVSNALGHGIGAMLIPPKGEYCPFTVRLNFNYTNNGVEYEACIMGLQAVMDKKVKKLKVYGDSTLVIYQLRGDWITRDSKLILYYQFVTKMIKYFEEIDFNHLPREENQMPDALATLVAMFKVNSSDEVQLIRMSIKEEGKSNARCTSYLGCHV